MSLQLLGLLRTGMLDYPGRVAATIFTMGCPLRCPYCHNPELIRGAPPEHFVPRSEVLQHIRARAHLLQGVAVTGGEPLQHRDLPDLVREITAAGLPVKIDTSGIFPDALEGLLQLPGVQYLAMDLKTLPQNYGRVAAGKNPAGLADTVRRSMELLRSWRDSRPERELEFRTTCAPGVVTAGDLFELPKLLLPGDVWTLTRFRPGGCFDPAWNELRPHPDTLLHRAAAAASARGIHSQVRGTAAG